MLLPPESLFKPCLTVALSALIVSCGAADTRSGGQAETFAPEPVYRHHQCDAQTQQTVLLNDEQALAEWWQPLARASLPPREPPAALSKVNWGEKNVVIIHAGSQPTAGYEVTLAGDTARVEGDTLIIPATLTKPPEDAMVAQVITSPCMAVAVDKDGYTKVKAVFSSGDSTGKAAVR